MQCLYFTLLFIIFCPAPDCTADTYAYTDTHCFGDNIEYKMLNIFFFSQYNIRLFLGNELKKLTGYLLNRG